MSAGLLPINFHHLQYFYAVASDGNLTRTAQRLRVSQSAVSSQIHQLEEQVGHALFARTGRRLELTEAGKITLAFATDIFATGSELVSTLKGGRAKSQPVRVGAVATLSRNFQRSFVRPLLSHKSATLQLQSGGFEELLARVENHELDVLLSNRPPDHALQGKLHARLLATQSASIVSSAPLPKFRFPDGLRHTRMILPGSSSSLRTDFDALCRTLGVKVKILAEVDDMATIRLLARDTGALALVPSIVVQDELREGQVHEVCSLPNIFESFYAISAERQYQHPHLRMLLERDEQELLQFPK